MTKLKLMTILGTRLEIIRLSELSGDHPARGDRTLGGGRRGLPDHDRAGQGHHFVEDRGYHARFRRARDRWHGTAGSCGLLHLQQIRALGKPDPRDRKTFELMGWNQSK